MNNFVLLYYSILYW